MKKSKLDRLKPGNIITGDDLLGGKPADVPAELRWLRGNESPVGEDLQDCRAFALNQVAASVEPDLAESFARNQQSDGRSFIGAVPENRLRCHLSAR